MRFVGGAVPRFAFSSLAQLQVSLFVALAACSGAGGTKAEPPSAPNYYASPTNVCALIREPELEAILGHRYSEGAGELNPDFLTLPGISTCGYPKAEDTIYPKVFVGVVYAYADMIFDQRAHIALTNRRPGSRGLRVYGMGEKAIWDPVIYQFFVLTRGKMLGVQSFPDLEPVQDHLKRVQRLAAKAIERLR